MNTQNTTPGNNSREKSPSERVAAVLGPRFQVGQTIQRENSKGEMVADIEILDASESSRWVTVKRGDSTWEFHADDILEWNEGDQIENASGEPRETSAEEITEELDLTKLMQGLGEGLSTVEPGTPVKIMTGGIEEVWKFVRTWQANDGTRYVEVEMDGGRAPGGIERRSIIETNFIRWNAELLAEDKAGIVEEIEKSEMATSSGADDSAKNDIEGKTPEEVERIEEEKAASLFRRGVDAFRDKSSSLFGTVRDAASRVFGKKESTPENPEMKIFMDEANAELAFMQENVTPKEKVGLFRGLVEMGLAARQYKNEGMSWVLSKAVMEKGNEEDWAAGEKAGAISRFFQKYSDNYKRDALRAKQNREDLYKPGGWLRQSARYGSGVGSLLGNSLLIARFFKGFGFNPFRTVGAAAIQIGRAGEVLKDVNLNRLSQDTRIEDVEEAMAEAQRIYEEAKKKSADGNVSKLELEKAYVQNLPEDILSKLSKDPEKFKFGFISQWLVKKEIKTSLGWLNKELNNIESLSASDEEKEKMKDTVRLKYGKYLKEMEVMVKEGGVVDLWAYASKIMEEVGKKASVIMVLETIAEGVIKVDKMAWDYFKNKFFDEPDLALENSKKIVAEAGGSAVIAENVSRFADAVNRIDEKIFENFEVTAVGDGLKLEDVFSQALASEGYTLHADLEQSKVIAQIIVGQLTNLGEEKIKELGISSGDVEKLTRGDKVDVNKLIGAALSQGGENPKERLAELLEVYKGAPPELWNDSTITGAVNNAAAAASSDTSAKDEKWETVFDKDKYEQQKTSASGGETSRAADLSQTTPVTPKDSAVADAIKVSPEKELSAEELDRKNYASLVGSEVKKTLDENQGIPTTETKESVPGLVSDTEKTREDAEALDRQLQSTKVESGDTVVPIKKISETSSVPDEATPSQVVEKKVEVSSAPADVVKAESVPVTVSSEISPKVEEKLQADIKDIFKTEILHKKGFAEEDWMETKKDKANTFLAQMESYRNTSKGRIIESLSIKRHLRLEEYIQKLASETNLVPKDDESIEDYIKRALGEKMKTETPVSPASVEKMVDMTDADKKLYATPFKVPADENVFEDTATTKEASPQPVDTETQAPIKVEEKVEKVSTGAISIPEDKLGEMARVEANKSVESIYHNEKWRLWDRWGAADWKDAKDQNAKTFLGVVSRFVPGRDIYQNSSMANHKQLVEHINGLMARTGIAPKDGETVRNFLERLTVADIKKLNGMKLEETVIEAPAINESNFVSQPEAPEVKAPETVVAATPVAVEEKDVLETEEGKVVITDDDEKRWLEEAKRQILESSPSKNTEELPIPVERPGEVVRPSSAIEEADRMGLSEELELMSRGAVQKELDTIYKGSKILMFGQEGGIKSPYWKNVKDKPMENFQRFYDTYGKDKAPITPFKRDENEVQFKLYKLLKRLHEQTGVKVKSGETVSEYMQRAMKELMAKIHHSSRETVNQN